MAFLSGKNNNFRFAFSKPFIPQEIEDKYSPVLNRIPGNMCETVLDFLNYSILPSIEPTFLKLDFTESKKEITEQEDELLKVREKISLDRYVYKLLHFYKNDFENALSTRS